MNFLLVVGCMYAIKHVIRAKSSKNDIDILIDYMEISKTQVQFPRKLVLLSVSGHFVAEYHASGYSYGNMITPG